MFKYAYFASKVTVFVFALLTLQFCSKESIVDQQLDTTDSPAISSTQNVISEEAAFDLQDFDLETGEVELRSRSYYTFNTLNQALRCTGLNGPVFEGMKTIYAPSDFAFSRLGLNEHNICDAIDKETLTSILLYHVADTTISTRQRGCVELINGDIAQLQTKFRYSLFINNSRAYRVFDQKGADYRLRVYSIDEVLTVPSATIAEAASSTDQFQVLFQAVLAADPAIAAALSDPDQILTVFAPTNQAFIDLLGLLNLPSLEALVEAIGVDGLSKVLLYHVVDGCAFSNDLVDGQMLTTLQGESLTVDLGNLQLKDATDTPAGLVAKGLDILTSNGIVHTIDKVLLPKEIVMGL